jgi:hypothetical protein
VQTTEFVVFINEITQNFVFGDSFSDSYSKTVTMSDGRARTIKLTPMVRDGRPVIELNDTGHISYMGLEGATTNGKLMVQLHEVPEELRGKLPKRGFPEGDAHKTATNFIATRDFTGIDSSGREFAIKLGIGAPYRMDGGDWACPMAIEGLHSLRKDGIVGVDAFQALMLAQRLAKQLLESHIQKGGQILDGPGGSPVSVEHIFSSGSLK